jgi:predicted membrane protein
LSIAPIAIGGLSIVNLFFADAKPPFTYLPPFPAYLLWPWSGRARIFDQETSKTMETYNRDSATTPVKPENSPSNGNRSGRVMGGLFVVVVGVLILARKAGVDLPRWIFSWEMIFIAVGLFIGFRHSFRNMTWLIFILIGSVLLLDDIFPYADISDFTWPMVIIAIGLIMIFRSGKKNESASWRKRWESRYDSVQNDSEDYIDSTAVFAGMKKNVISKNFKGGEATAVFGGSDINLMQADMDGKIVLELTAVFGGIKLLVPPHWKIQSGDLVAVFGGVEDKRPQVTDPSTVDSNKVLVLQGTCIFGGIDIKSY